MMEKVLSVCLLALLVPCSLAFLHGRPKGGFLLDPPTPEGMDLPAAQWFSQRLDHFNAQETRTWQQRYFVNSTFYRPGGPVFLQIGGEGTANPIWVVVGHMMVLAEKYSAMAVLLEHRYYGESHPVEDMSLENMKYLSSEQALADLANFRIAFGKLHNVSEAKWMSFGGSYPGALSAWLRLKYPHLIHGAVASSAPVEAKVNFIEYLEVVQRSLEYYGTTECVSSITEATSFLNSIISTEAGRTKLTEMFKLCKPLQDDHDDIASFANTLAGNFMGVVQYNRDNVAFEGRVTTNISTICNIMVNSSGDALERYALVNQALLKLYNSSCTDASYADSITELKETSWKSAAAEGGRQWTYQVCSEFAYLQSSDGSSSLQPFGHLFPLSSQVQMCTDVFGPNFTLESITAAVEWTNTNYGSLKISGSRIIFPNGNIDPWHALSILPPAPSPSILPVFIQGTAHCANMYPSSEKDSLELIAGRATIDVFVGEFLSAN